MGGLATTIALVAIFSAAIIYGTGLFCALVVRPAASGAADDLGGRSDRPDPRVRRPPPAPPRYRLHHRHGFDPAVIVDVTATLARALGWIPAAVRPRPG